MTSGSDLEADYVVVGGGTSGSIVASRLSEQSDVSVILLEAGPRDRSLRVHIPIGFSRLLSAPDLNWCYETEPQQNLNGRRIAWPRGKVIGGSSSINGLIWTRGDPEDFDEWSRLTGDAGWSWQALQPYFQRLEAACDDCDERLGRSGAIPLEIPAVRNPAVEAFIAVGAERGLPMREGLVISDACGVGRYLTTTRKGLRVSSAKAYLHPARHRPNLRILSGALVSRILFDDERAASGVTAVLDGQSMHVRARRGVVLAAGTINTPQLLMLSGIGPGAYLKEYGIPVQLDMPEVGRNLQDHFGVRIINRIKPPVSVNSDFRRPWRLLSHAVRYALFRTGPLTMGGAHAGAFLAINTTSRPNIQVNFLPLSVKGPGWDFHPFSAVTANVCQMRPASKGQITLRSSDAFAAPAIDPNYLGEETDRETMVSAIRFVRELLQEPAFSEPMGAEEFMPGAIVQEDDALLDYIREQGSTVFHPVGTCRMGEDKASVVSSKGAVRSTRCLWLADASIMPTLPSCNTNAPTAVIAERITEHIREDSRAGGR